MRMSGPDLQPCGVGSPRLPGILSSSSEKDPHHRRESFFRSRRGSVFRRATATANVTGPDLHAFPPRPAFASAPAVSAGATNAGKAGEGPGVRGARHPASPEARTRSAPSTRAVADRGEKLPPSIQPQKRDSPKISFLGIRDVTPQIGSQERSGASRKCGHKRELETEESPIRLTINKTTADVGINGTSSRRRETVR
jgi:hypothetical protein